MPKFKIMDYDPIYNSISAITHQVVVGSYEEALSKLHDRVDEFELSEAEYWKTRKSNNKLYYELYRGRKKTHFGLVLSEAV